MNNDVEQGVIEKKEEPKVCPWWAESMPITILLIIDVLVCKYYIDPQTITWRYPIYSYIFGSLCLVWFVYMITDRTIYGGIGGFYDAYWFCNIGLVLTALGVFFALPTLIGQSMCLLLMPHISFWIDFVCYPCLKRCVVGAFPFMFDESTAFHEKVTSYHHFWFFPGIVFLLLGQAPISLASFYLSALLFLLLIVLSRYMTPLEYVNPDGSRRYLNVCCAHEYPEFATHIQPFKWSIGKPFVVYVSVIFFFYVVPVNFISFILIVLIQKGINSLL